MTHPLSAFRRSSRTVTVALGSVAVTAAITIPGLALAGVGHGGPHSVPAPPASPTSADQFQNIDQVKTAIKAYYGDTTTAVVDPVPAGDDDSYDNDTTAQQLHQPGADSAYAHEVEGIAGDASRYLAHEAKPRQKHTGTPAILFDVDDTTLNTYSYEIYSNFVYNPKTNGYFVDAGRADVFPAVPGMVALEQKALSEGYTVFFLTGRPESQRPGTQANLTDAGYTIDPAHVYLKDETQPWITCDTTGDNKCTTEERKSETRAYLESQGYDIVANFGDQYSDLRGGYADRTYKIPNPMYYLP